MNEFTVESISQKSFRYLSSYKREMINMALCVENYFLLYSENQENKTKKKTKKRSAMVRVPC